MAKYEKPIVTVNEDVSEGVYAASGTGTITNCWTVNAYIHQRPETGRGDYRIQVDATHSNPDHHLSSAIVTITFNQIVTVVNPGGGSRVVSSTTDSSISVAFNIGTYNPNEHKGWGDLIVTSDDGLQILNVSIVCEGI